MATAVAQQEVQQVEQEEQKTPRIERKVSVERKPSRISTKTQKQTLRRPVTSTNEKKQSIWGRSQRYPEARVTTPGPGKYSLPPGAKITGRSAGGYSPGYSMRSRTLGAVGSGFALSKRRGHDAVTPGPGAYEVSPMNNKGKTFSGLFSVKTEVTPGPSDYTTVIGNCGRDKAHKYTMRARTKSAWAADFSRTAPALGKSQSAPNFKGLTADAPTPGPNAYNPFTPFGKKGLKKSFAIRLSSKDPSYPGPGKYDHTVNIVGKTGHSYTMHDRTKKVTGPWGTSDGSFIDGDKPRKTMQSPGPGRYNHATTFHKQSFNSFANTRAGRVMHTASLADYDKPLPRKPRMKAK